MSRRPRIPGDILHVIVRGIGKQILFEDDADREFFLSLLQRFRDETGITLMAYCLMENHVHLLIRDPERSTSLFMKKLGISYAGYYNRKYDRVGHLFQDRFKSETVTDDAYLLTVYRYILRNPEKAGISTASSWPWSSYAEYGRTDGLTDSSLLFSMIGPEPAFKSYMTAEDTTECMEADPRKHDDEWALGIIRETCSVTSGTELQKLSKPQRDEALSRLKAQGISVRQLERLTGINRGVVQNA